MEERILRGAQTAHVDEGQDHALDRAAGAVREDAHEERTPRSIVDLALEALAGERPGEVARDVLVADVVGEGPDRAGHVLRAGG